ncbi:hypothetical protein EKL30_09300 [Candidimonas sp. SYP-B2681]|uniref:DUF6776 family protein n=1 Tax=Candidimonas sp. SYP-B2681 TaxID=2497686 RepID=UPI000F884FF5|nr:DUF6776 family protein [Candidimonas sp. SYP-B2681]RTZ44741.1 hypothetical protein EKL30_09300 [Candidimonas sp. SYP-B2681]
MFGSSQRRVFKPTAYGNTRRARRIPRWLVLMFTGIVLGAGGLLFLQKSYGPTRLTVEQSEQLHYDLNSTNMDKQRLQSQFNQQTHDVKETRSKLESQATELKEAKEQLAKLTADIQLFADAMPPDPRGTSPGIRAASFDNDAGQLAYQILVMQDKGKAETFTGEVDLVVAGRYSNGKSGSIDLPPFNIELQQYTHVHGSAPLPEGFTARQVTIKITPQGSKKLSATRTLRVAR